jgi:diguanylate cyclase (GGDEF)-like protein
MERGRDQEVQVADLAWNRKSPNGADVSAVEAQLLAKTNELKTLYAALNNIKAGVILLSKDLRAQFANAETHAMFKSPPELMQGQPLFADMLQWAKKSSAYAVSQADVDAYVAARLKWVQSADPTPIDQKLSSGQVIRCRCAGLPDGGRMLVYSDVTDIVRHSEELERLATTDGMTGIYNRRHFLTLADREWERASRYGRPLAFLMIDIDHFKRINDQHGHEVGDQVIMQVAKLATGCKRTIDVLARIGGEEFALLLPETNLKEAMIAAERLREQVAAGPLVGVPAAISATVSIGVAEVWRSSHGIADVMRAADQALYEAKRRGRNLVKCTVSDLIPSGDSERDFEDAGTRFADVAQFLVAER